ncbi:antitoxin Xre-like helix-turn-helix domain-containing protein [Marinibaculum pumilum]|uniref:Antitoxin Xre-like helix-turn-helix domain-containing protein n=1 Tax=Marinibaculum pumilum TaxID=1766165 RepID=A0ABV7L9Y7_9PROT
MSELRQVEGTRASPDDGPITDVEGAAMARAAVNLFRRWRLTEEQACILLGGISQRTFARWKAGEVGRLSRDLKARLSNLMGIHKALRIIFRDPRRAYDWVHQPNAAYGGRAALDVMLGGELTDIMRVRRYLDAERGGW